MASLRKLLFGSRPRLKRQDIFTPEQQDLLSLILRQAQGQPFNEDFFQRSFVDPALQNFRSRIAPSIQQQFIASGAARGSNLQDALLRAGADVQGNLAQLRGNLLQQELGRQIQRQQLALGARPQAFVEQQGSVGLIPSLFKGASLAAAKPLGIGLGSLFNQRQGFLQ